MKKALQILLALIIILLIAAYLFRAKIYRLQFAQKMFSGVEMVERFRSVEAYFPTRIIKAAETPSPLTKGPFLRFPAKFKYDGELKSVEQLMSETDVTGLMVMRNDTVYFENYFRENTAASHTIAWSVTKSFVSALCISSKDHGMANKSFQKTGSLNL